MMPLDDIVLTTAVTLLAVCQLMFFAGEVSSARLKYRIPCPRVTGNVKFERIFRAQQNSLDYFPVFMVTLWKSSIFLHKVPSCLVGLVYIYSRQEYFKGYSKSVRDRIPGFRRSVNCLIVMLSMALIGCTVHLLCSYGDFVRYKLSPEYPYPKPFDEFLRATAHLLQNAEKCGVNPQRIAIAGDSAGGNLVAGSSPGVVR